MSPKYDYDLLEKRLNDLVNLVGSDFPRDTQEYVREYIDVGEYGLALELAVASITKNGLCIEAVAFELIKKLAVQMGIDDKIITRELSELIMNKSK